MKKTLLIKLTLLTYLLCCKHKQSEKAENIPIHVEEKRPDGKTALVKTDKVNLRQNPDTKSALIALLNKGDIVQLSDRTPEPEKIYSCNHHWFKVTNGGKTGWVYGEFLTDFRDTKWTRETFWRSAGQFSIKIPASWEIRGTIDDFSNQKMAEILDERGFEGDLKSHVIKELKTFDGSEFPMKLKNMEPFEHKSMKVYKAIIQTGYEGGCPVPTGTWYIVEYYFLYAPNAYLPVAFYLRSLDDDYHRKLFDEIAQSVTLSK